MHTQNNHYVALMQMVTPTWVAFPWQPQLSHVLNNPLKPLSGSITGLNLKDHNIPLGWQSLYDNIPVMTQLPSNTLIDSFWIDFSQDGWITSSRPHTISSLMYQMYMSVIHFDYKLTHLNPSDIIDMSKVTNINYMLW